MAAPAPAFTTACSTSNRFAPPVAERAGGGTTGLAWLAGSTVLYSTSTVPLVLEGHHQLSKGPRMRQTWPLPALFRAGCSALVLVARHDNDEDDDDDAAAAAAAASAADALCYARGGAAPVK